MKRALLLFVLFLGALAIAVGAWIVEGVRWLVTAPVRRVRAAAESEGGLAG